MVREHYRNMLSKDLQNLYDALCKDIIAMNDKIKVHVYCDVENAQAEIMQDISDVMYLIALDHPEILWYAHQKKNIDGAGSVCITSSIEGWNATVVPTYYKDAYNAVMPKYSFFEFTEREIAMRVLQEMIKHIIYDKNHGVQSAYGVACLGTGVCMGYALYFKWLLEKNGISCKVIVGDAGTDGKKEPHAWCVANLDGEDCYIDPTWCDPIVNGKQEHVVDETWFGFNPNDGTHIEEMEFNKYFDGSLDRAGWYGDRFDPDDLSLVLQNSKLVMDCFAYS